MQAGPLPADVERARALLELAVRPVEPEPLAQAQPSLDGDRQEGRVVVAALVARRPRPRRREQLLDLLVRPLVRLVRLGVRRRPVLGVEGRERARRDQLLLDREAEHGPERLEDVLDRVLAQLALAVVL